LRNISKSPRQSWTSATLSHQPAHSILEIDASHHSIGLSMTYVLQDILA
jgi:hypothetical protein